MMHKTQTYQICVDDGNRSRRSRSNVETLCDRPLWGDCSEPSSAVKRKGLCISVSVIDS